jgi:hypothetical protein
MNIARAVRRSNVRYDLTSFQSGHEYIPPYVANGWIGGCMDEFGFPSRPDCGYDHGRRLIACTNHYYRCANGGHNQAALLAIEPSRADGRAWTFDGQTDVSVGFRAGCALMLEWGNRDAASGVRCYPDTG